MANDIPPRTEGLDESAAAAAPTSFDVLPLSEELRQSLQEMGYLAPMPVQVAVWEPVVAGRDLVVQARTGTGKTAAFGLPIIDRLIKRTVKSPQALVLCPTRELALQVGRELDLLGKHKKVTTVAIYGGAPMPAQTQALARNCPLVVGTPGRVLDHLRRGTLDPSQIRLLVLDESDEMLSMGFEKELTAILDHLPENRQTLLFSATLPPDIERMVRTRLRKPEFLMLSGDHIGALGIAHYVYMVTEDKPQALVDVIEVENPESAIVFCNTKDDTERVAQTLRRHGFRADWLNGDLPQSDREKVMAATRAGQLRLLIATDVAARGIDISHLTHVINYDFPQDTEGYVHRTGRTGRAGKIGTAITLITAQDIGGLYMLRLTYGIKPIERHLPTAREQRSRLETDVVEALAKHFLPCGRHPDFLALARRVLSHDEVEPLIAGMLSEHLSTHPGFAEWASTRRREAVPPPTAPPVRERPERPERPRPPSPKEVPPMATPSEPAKPPEVAKRGLDEVAPRGEPTPGVQVRHEPDEEPDTLERGQDEGVPGPGFIELYVNVGRKDGVRPRDLKALLHDDGGLAPELVGRVRVRDRCSFVDVEPNAIERAIALLQRGVFSSREVQASVSSRSARGPLPGEPDVS